MSKAEPQVPPPNGNEHASRTFTNDQGLSKRVGPQDVAAPSNGKPTTPDYLAQISDLRVSADKIRCFAELDLGELVNLPSARADLVALSIRMSAAFMSLLQSTLQLIAEDHEDISRMTLETVSRELALNFIERYGTLAFFSSDVITLLWSAQRLESAKGLKFLRQVGQSLAVFVAGPKSVDIAFTLGKRQFLAEIEQLSRDLGEVSSNDSKAEQLIRFVRTGKYSMLRQNLRQLEQFLGCDEINPHLRARNQVVAERLAQYGARGLTIERGESITPDWFFYTWVAWIVNKSPKTVRRLIQTAETRLKSQISGYEKSYKR
jgi:hypothetical protein